MKALSTVTPLYILSQQNVVTYTNTDNAHYVVKIVCDYVCVQTHSHTIYVVCVFAHSHKHTYYIDTLLLYIQTRYTDAHMQGHTYAHTRTHTKSKAFSCH